MAYSRVTRTAHGADALWYILGDGEGGHNGAEQRNQYVYGVNMLPGEVVPYDKQMQTYWNRARSNHTTQIDRFVVSFSRKELDPDNPADIAKAGTILCEIAQKLGPDHQALVAVQTDGVGGLIHGHIAMNDVSMVTNKGLAAKQYYFPAVKHIVDEICAQYIDLDKGTPAPERETQTVRAKREKNEAIEKANAAELQKAAAEDREPVLQEKEYIWTDDLKGRIREAAKESSSEEQFMSGCRRRGVEVERRKATKQQPEYYLFELVDISKFGEEKIPTNLKRKSFKLGSNYQPEGIAKMSRAANLQDFRDAAPPEPVKVPKVEPPKKDAAATVEQDSLATARAEAKRTAKGIYDAAHGWEAGLPRKADGHIDFAEADRRRDEFEAFWAKFPEWRRQNGMRGQKMAPIYQKDQNNVVSLKNQEFRKQFTAYMDNPEIIYEDVIVVPQDDDEPPMPSRRPQERRDGHKDKNTGKEQEKPQETPQEAQDDDAERQRSLLAGWRMALVNEAARQTDEREEEKQRQQARENGWDEQ